MVAKVGVSLFGSFYAFCLEEEAINVEPTINTISGILMIFSRTWTSLWKMKPLHHLDLVLDVGIDYNQHHYQ